MDYDSLIDTVEQARKTQINQGQWSEAKKSTAKLKELKEKQAGILRKSLRVQQSEDMKLLEEVYTQDLLDFNRRWDQHISDFRSEVRNKEQELITSHNEMLSQEKARLEEKIPVIPKHNKEYFKLKKIQELVVKKNDFQEAHRLQKKIDKIAQENTQEWLEIRNEKVNVKLKQIQHRLTLERQNFRKRAQATFDELKIQRTKELEVLVKKYKNNRQDLDCLQKREHSYMNNRTLLMSRLNSTRSFSLNNFDS